MVEAITQAMETGVVQRDRARRAKRVWGALAVAAAVVLAVGLGSRFYRSETQAAGRFSSATGTVWTVRSGSKTMVASSQSRGLALGPSDDIATGSDGSAIVELASGPVVRVGPSSQVTMADASREIGLAWGTVEVDVPKLATGHTFAVRTPDSMVTVHGTSFSVQVSGSRWPATRVEVREGTVAVSHAGVEQMLRAGSSWTSAAEAPALVSADPSASAAAVPVAPGRPVAAVAGPGAPRTSSALLAEQNRVFSEAMAGRDHGGDAATARMLADFIARYPTAPLCEDAYVERFRALHRAGDVAAAAQAARRYLAVYPGGFARDEAKKLALPEHP